MNKGQTPSVVESKEDLSGTWKINDLCDNFGVMYDGDEFGYEQECIIKGWLHGNFDGSYDCLTDVMLQYNIAFETMDHELIAHLTNQYNSGNYHKLAEVLYDWTAGNINTTSLPEALCQEGWDPHGMEEVLTDLTHAFVIATDTKPICWIWNRPKFFPTGNWKHYCEIRKSAFLNGYSNDADVVKFLESDARKYFIETLSLVGIQKEWFGLPWINKNKKASQSTEGIKITRM